MIALLGIGITMQCWMWRGAKHERNEDNKGCRLKTWIRLVMMLVVSCAQVGWLGWGSYNVFHDYPDYVKINEGDCSSAYKYAYGLTIASK